MKKRILIITCLFMFSVGILAEELPPHPRILCFQGEEEVIAKMVEQGTWQQVVHRTIINESNAILKKSPSKYELKGKRLLDVSREAFRRIFYLSYGYRVTGNRDYFSRAEQELLAVCKFSDWNPSHFLDVAEMTLGVSIGYDWLFNDLPESSRKAIREAIQKKGLEVSENNSYNSWLKKTNNWNQVCNAGMVYGALAIYEDQPDMAQRIIQRALQSVQAPMALYAPDGNYPEGYGYWGYGTSFNVLMLAALEKIYGNRYDELINPAFMKTAAYYLHMEGPSSKCFNYSDSGDGVSVDAAMFWFAKRLSDPSLLWKQKDLLQGYQLSVKERILPSLLVWCSDYDLSILEAPKEKIWYGQGKNPVALMRTSWNSDSSIFIGLKAGTPSCGHGHMDVGSFVLDINRVRWALDLGPDDYTSVENAGIDLWSYNQDSPRWNLFRYNNKSHNTLTFDDQKQTASGTADIQACSDADPDFIYAVTDLSKVYKGQVNEIVRGISIVKEKYILIQDEIKTVNRPTRVRWNIMTRCPVEIDQEQKSASLSYGGKKVILRVISPGTDVTMKTWSVTPEHVYEYQNAGYYLVGFEAELPANSSEKLVVQMVPEEYLYIAGGYTIAPISKWGADASSIQEINKPVASGNFIRGESKAIIVDADAVNASVCIVDCEGRIVQQKDSINNPERFAVNPGYYIVKIQSGNRQVIQKVIVHS